MVERLPLALHIAETHEREVYGVTNVQDIDCVLRSYREFVALCARKERETGQPCLIVANW